MNRVNFNIYEHGPDAAMDWKVSHLIIENITLNSQVNIFQITNQVETKNENPFGPFYGDIVEV